MSLREAILDLLLEDPAGMMPHDVAALLPDWGGHAVRKRLSDMGQAGELPRRIAKQPGGGFRYWHSAHVLRSLEPPARPASTGQVGRRPIERLAECRVEWRQMGGRLVRCTIGPTHDPQADLERTAGRDFRDRPYGRPRDNGTWGAYAE